MASRKFESAIFPDKEHHSKIRIPNSVEKEQNDVFNKSLETKLREYFCSLYHELEKQVDGGRKGPQK
jgi:hypothetical protein